MNPPLAECYIWSTQVIGVTARFRLPVSFLSVLLNNLIVGVTVVLIRVDRSNHAVEVCVYAV